MSDGPLPDWPDTADELLAAEYALGVLDAGERRVAQTRLESDSAFARLVAAWEERLVPLAESIDEQPPLPETWSRIEQRLGIAAPAVAAARPASMWNSVALWRWFAFAAGGLAAACLAIVLLSTAPGPAAAPMIATIAGEGGAPLFVAVIDEAAGTLSVMPFARPADAQHAHELWIIGANESPLSLGVIPGDGMRRVALAPANMDRARKGAALAVSLEPAGGSPNGKPTTVLGAGAIQRL